MNQCYPTVSSTHSNEKSFSKSIEISENEHFLERLWCKKVKKYYNPISVPILWTFSFKTQWQIAITIFVGRVFSTQHYENCKKNIYFWAILKSTEHVSEHNDIVNISKSRDLYVKHLHNLINSSYFIRKLTKSWPAYDKTFKQSQSTHISTDVD